VLSPNDKGGIAEMKIATAAVELGVPVLRPVRDHCHYDLVFDVGDRLYRVQCKWGRLIRAGSVVQVKIQRSRCTPAGYVRSGYSPDELDFVAVYCGALDRCYLLPAELAVQRNEISLRVSPPLNGQRACINLAGDFEFAGAVAQLEEHRHGMARVRGSSPLSSTSSAPPEVISANKFRNRFGWYMERAAAGEVFEITRHGKPFVRITSAGQLPLGHAGEIARPYDSRD
jgi:prevent-host-death family protein